MNRSDRSLSGGSPRLFQDPIFFYICLLGLTALLLYPIFINGFPLLNYDTGTYLESAITFKVPPDRPIGYSFLLTVGRVTDSLDTVVLIQSVVTAYLLMNFLQSCLEARRYWITASLAGLILLTPLPFVVSFLYPDITSFWIPLAALMFFRQNSVPGRRIMAFLILTFSVLTSYANVGLVLFSVAIISFGNFLASPAKAEYLKKKGAPTLVLLVFFLLLPPSLNLLLDYGFSYSKTSHVFIFGNYISGGRGGVLRGALLNLPESDPGNPLNDHLDLLLAEKKRGPSWFLWSADSPITTDPRLSGWVGNRVYLQPVINEAVRNNFPALLRKIGREVLRQIFIIQPGYICGEVGEEAKILSVLKTYFPSLHSEYLISRQQRGRLSEKMTEYWVDGFFRVSFIIISGMTVILLLLLPLIGKKRRADKLGCNLDSGRKEAVFLLVFYLVSNILVVSTGGISPRYSTRVSPLVVLAFFPLLSLFLRMIRGGIKEGP